MSGANVKKLHEIIEKCKQNQIDLGQMASIKNRRELAVSLKKYNIFVGVVVIMTIVYYNYDLFTDDTCALLMPNSITKVLRHPESCDFCRNVHKVSRVENISPDEFEYKFAYDARPVIITDAMKNWTAMSIFDFWYFKDIYENVRKNKKKWNCQFFPYKTDVKSLHEALSIPKERVNYEPGTKPWYFGWSNCNREVAELLRQHYGRPYFLPRTSENNAIDWIFMGGPGLGANMHVDNVRLPSWQGQVKGTKEWTLAPPAECYYECAWFKATVWTGDISERFFHLYVPYMSIGSFFFIFY